MAKAKRIIGLAADAPTGRNARIIARTRLAEIYDWDAYVDEPYHVRNLHNLRIAAKRLRYTLEIFQDVLPEGIEANIKEVEQVQEELGALHDSDVMIALLRLCLGSQDSGTGYEYVLARASKLWSSGDFIVNPALVASLLDPTVAPSAQQRHGLELLLSSLQQQRNEQYNAFRKHWYELKGKDFRRELESLLES